MSFQRRFYTLTGSVLAVALASVGVAPTAQADARALSLRPTLASATPAPPTKTLPVAVDVKTPYQGQVSCDPRPKPGVTAFAALMKARYGTVVAGTYRPCQGDVSEHYDGRALDWMLSVNNPQQKAIANSVVTWLSAGGGVMARRLGISYIIWNHRVWKEYRPERGWTAYTGAVPHTDHIHLSFSWDGAMKRTSWWTGRATTVVDVGPCRVSVGQFAPLYRAMRTAACPTNLAAAAVSPYRTAVFGQSSAQIAMAQRRLGLTASGRFDTATFNKVVSWQRLTRVPVTGVLDKATWVRLFGTSPVRVVAPTPIRIVSPAPAPRLQPALVWTMTRYTPYKAVVLRPGSRGAAVVVLQRGLKVTPDGDFGPRTRAALVAFQTRQRIVPNGLVGRAVWDRLEKLDYPLFAYRRVILRQGSKGATVVVLQRALRVTADGAFGPRTGAAVMAVQSSARIARTGVVNGPTWVAVESRMPR